MLFCCSLFPCHTVCNWRVLIHFGNALLGTVYNWRILCVFENNLSDIWCRW
jgi:hypothetical protein